jgi:serine/threonine protein kinase
LSDQTGTGGPTGAPEPAPGSGPASVGPYRSLRALGEGEFGTVYEAEQPHPARRRVALKVINPGMDTLEVIARVEAERQALALMDHPYIARVLDAGATESGRPYFVMELVQGEPIAAHCDRNRLTDMMLLTERQQLLGTPLYTSPEQAEGSADIDTRTDIYSVGVVLYDLLTGTASTLWRCCCRSSR